MPTALRGAPGRSGAVLGALETLLLLSFPFAFLYLKFFAFKTQKGQSFGLVLDRARTPTGKISRSAPPFLLPLSVFGRGLGAELQRPACRSSRRLGPVLPEPVPCPKREAASPAPGVCSGDPSELFLEEATPPGVQNQNPVSLALQKNGGLENPPGSQRRPLLGARCL